MSYPPLTAIIRLITIVGSMVSIPDLLSVTLIFSTILITGAVIYVAYHLVNALKSIKEVADDVRDTTSDIHAVKEGLKVGALTLVSTILGKLGGNGIQKPIGRR